jgi:hypothetical protein
MHLTATNLLTGRMCAPTASPKPSDITVDNGTARFGGQTRCGHALIDDCAGELARQRRNPAQIEAAIGVSR